MTYVWLMYDVGVSLQANTQALMTLAGLQSTEDILLTAWNNDTFRPCHYVAVDRTRRNIILAVRGSLEVRNDML